MSDVSADVVVVGNGAIGSSIAFELQRRGHQVVLVGESARPYAASVAAGAMLGCFGEVTTSLLASESGRAKLATDHRARAEWPEWDYDLGVASGDERSLYVANGTFVLLNSMGTAAVDSGNFRAVEEALREYEEPYESVDPEQIDWLAPEELARSLRGLYIPSEHAVDAHRLLDKLKAGFLRYGGRIVDAAAAGLELRGERVVGVRLADGDRLTGDQVVVAAGVQSLALLDAVDEVRRRIPPLVSGYGVSALLEVGGGTLPTSVLRTPNRAFACGIHCVPRGDGVLYVGGTNVLTKAPRQYATVRDLQFLLECAVDQLSSELPQSGVRAVQVGNRPVPADGFPLIGGVGIEGLWLATGTYRDGLHQSPLIAKFIAAKVEGDPWESDSLTAFAPVRSPLPFGAREQIIQSTVQQTMASGYEQRWRVTPEWPVRIEAQLRREYTEAVEKLHPTFTPPPEFIAKMNEGIRENLKAYYDAWS
ncbi:NAD(P)/FAD-dependent oxidoreductase [Kitasatospora sp. NPDC056783]|uniref:NAD(P)/FAD-dependent oxidoreductase n=1 Tax=Kitasatospora sp. NPDC056783 TaxID=3345943 RepID=UPI00369A8131